MASEFGAILKDWRKTRRFSQLDLSLEAEMSARHLSFLESGRANPSREMVLRLSEALQLPRPAANQALNAAGFAPVYPSLSDDAPELAPVHQAISAMLDHHDPFPGYAIDRHWNVVNSNQGAQMLLALASPGGPANLIDILINSAGLDLIKNWDEVAILSLSRLRTEILELGVAVLGDRAIRLGAGYQGGRDADRTDVPDGRGDGSVFRKIVVGIVCQRFIRSEKWRDGCGQSKMV